MSLINDALKRAKETQQQRPAAPPPGPPLRPVERPRGRGGNLWLVVAFAVVLAAAAVLLWQGAQQSHKPARDVAVKTPVQALPKETLRPTPPAPNQSQAAATPSSSQPVESKPALARPTLAPPTSVASNAVAAAGSPAAPVATGAPPAAIEAPPKPVLKLQGVVYHPTRPSVIINGKTLFIGDRIAEFRVTAIDRESATLVGGGTTNVLSLQ